MACLRGGGETFIVKSFSSTAGTPAVPKGYTVLKRWEFFTR